MAGVLARRDRRYRLPLSDGAQAASCVVDVIPADAFDALVSRNLCRNSGSIGVSPMALLVTSMWRISSVCASMPQWTLRHSLRYSAPCFLRFHSPSPRNLMPVLSTSSCSADLVRWWRSSTCKVFWHRQTVLKSGTGQYSLANCSRLSLHHAHRLPQGLAEQALDAQAELDGCVRACRSACQTIASPSPATSSTNRCLQVCPEAEPA